MGRNSFSERKRLFFRGPALMAGIAVVCTGIALITFYETLMRQHRTYLANEIGEQLNWLDAMGRANGWNTEATLKEFTEYGVKHDALGKTGEFMLVIRDGDQIHLLFHKNAGSGTPCIATPKITNGPIGRALAGDIGTMVGPDYRGHTVLAAFAPVPELNGGIVAKTDLYEVLAPFLKSAGIITFTVLVIIIGGSCVVVQLARPLITELEESQACVASAIRRSKQGLHS